MSDHTAARPRPRAFWADIRFLLGIALIVASVAGVWLVWYGLARAFVEVFREPENIHALNLGPFTAGQFYSVPMLLFGAWLIWRAGQDAGTAATKA